MKMELKARPCDAPWRNYEKPKGTKEYRGMIDGWLRTWQEYVPSCYDGSKPVPLVLSVHGSAYHHADSNTAWQLIAERENFIVVYPHSLIEEIKFNVWNTFSESDGMPDDAEYFDQLIDRMLEKYNIDESRIYIQGQSVGDGMTSTYLFLHGNRIAAAAPLSGPTSPVNFVDPQSGEIFRYPKYPVPVVRTHGSEDTMQPMGGLGKICVMAASGEEHPIDRSEQARKDKWIVGQKINLDVWRKVNGGMGLPKLGMKGRYNWMVYEGENCNTAFYSVEGGQHGPYLDMADNIWSCFFSGYRKVHGESVYIGADREMGADTDAIALADGSDSVYVHNKKIKLEGNGKVREINGEFYVPAKALEQLFANTSVKLYENGGPCARIYTENGELQAAAGNRAVVWNETLQDMPTSLVFEEKLYVPVAWIAELVFGYEPVSAYHVCYIGHGGQLTYDMAYVIREILGTEPEVTPAQSLAREHELRQLKSKDYKPHNIAGDKYKDCGPDEVFQILKEQYQKELDAYQAKENNQAD